MFSLGHDLDDLLELRRLNAILAWVAAGAIGLVALWQLLAGDLAFDALGALVVAAWATVRLADGGDQTAAGGDG